MSVTGLLVKYHNHLVCFIVLSIKFTLILIVCIHIVSAQLYHFWDDPMLKGASHRNLNISLISHTKRSYLSNSYLWGYSCLTIEIGVNLIDSIIKQTIFLMSYCTDAKLTIFQTKPLMKNRDWVDRVTSLSVNLEMSNSSGCTWIK